MLKKIITQEHIFAVEEGYLKLKFGGSIGILDVRKLPPPLRSPLDMVFLNLKMRNLLPTRIRALDLFGDHGLKTTYDYTPLCESVDLWEIDKMTCRIASRIHKGSNITVNQGDSILALRSMENKRYNLVVSDNPFSVYGANEYCENFDIFPHVFNILQDESVLILNVFLDLERFCLHNKMQIPQKWTDGRKNFFKREDVKKISPDEMIHLYKSKVPKDKFNISDAFLVPRNPELPWLVLCLRRKK